jgi:hypothetical protein
MIINGESQGRVSDMGTKRVGLARVEALIEALDRDLELSSTTLTNVGASTFASTVGVTGASTLTGKVTCQADLVGAAVLQSPACGTVAPTNISATALSVNTRYNSIAAATAMTIPSAAAGAIGDWITVFYGVAAGNGNAHTYTTTTDTAYTLGSTAQRVGGGVASTADISVAADNVLTITGHTNGDGGLGTIVRFVNTTGAAQGWSVEAITYGAGTNAQAGTIAFS